MNSLLSVVNRADKVFQDGDPCYLLDKIQIASRAWWLSGKILDFRFSYFFLFVFKRCFKAFGGFLGVKKIWVKIFMKKCI